MGQMGGGPKGTQSWEGVFQKMQRKPLLRFGGAGELEAVACNLLYEDYVWVSLGNAMKATQSKVQESMLPVKRGG